MAQVKEQENEKKQDDHETEILGLDDGRQDGNDEQAPVEAGIPERTATADQKPDQDAEKQG